MNRTVGLIGAAGVGASLMYFFDPDRGKRRRAEIRNKARHINRVTTVAIGKTQRDVRNHLLGVVSEMKSFIRHEVIPDEVLEARVRSKMGRVVSHPHAIEVKAREGLIILKGSILSAEVLPFVDAVAAIPGVKNIENCLELHETPADVPALQGGRRRLGKRFGPFKTTWSPTTRLVAGMAGGALTVYGGKRRGAFGSFLSTIGVGVVARALTNVEARRLVGIDGEGKGIVLDKTMTTGAPTGVQPQPAASQFSGSEVRAAT